MAEMFGVSDAEVNLRDPLRRAQAQEALGRVAMQPAEQALKEAHAADYQAQAQERLLKVKRAADLDALSQAALTNGEPLEAEQANDFLGTQWQSLSTPLERIYRLGVKQGTSASTLLPLAEKIALIREKEAKAGGEQFAAQDKYWKAQITQATRYGSLARTALRGPREWAQLRLQTPELNHLPQSWEMARPYLENLVTSAMTVKDTIEAERKAARDKVLEGVSASTIARNRAAEEASKAQTKVREYKYEVTKKNGGVGDPVTKRNKELKNQALEAEIAAKHLRIAPKVPVKDQLEIGQAYTLPGKRIGVWERGSDGQLGFRLTTIQELGNVEEESDNEEGTE